MTAEAKARFREGLDFYKAHKNTEARAKYLQALALSQSAAIYLNLAIVEYDLLMYPDALRHAKAYVLHPKAEAAKVDKLKREMIPDLESKTAHLSVEGQAGVAVFVDGEKVGVAPIADQVHVAPGEHTVACGTVTKTVVVKAGDTATVIVVIREAVPPAASATPSATVAPPAGASTTPQRAASSAAPAPAPSVGPPQEGRSTLGWALPISGGVVGVAGVVGGVVFLGNASDAHNKGVAARGNENCTGSTSAGCQQASKYADDEQSAKNLAVGGFIVGGIGVVGGVVAWLLLAPRGTVSTSYVTPLVGRDGAGVVYGTSF